MVYRQSARRVPAVPESQPGKSHPCWRSKVLVRQLADGKERREIVPRFIELRTEIGWRYFYNQTIFDCVAGFLSNLDMYVSVPLFRARASNPSQYRKGFRFPARPGFAPRQPIVSGKW